VSADAMPPLSLLLLLLLLLLPLLYYVEDVSGA